MFCVISSSSFPIIGLHNVKQDFTLNLKTNNILNRLTITCHVMFTLFAMGHKKRFLRHAVTDNTTIKKTPKPQHNYEMKQFYSCAVIQIFRIHTTARNRPKSKPLFGDLPLYPEQWVQRP